MPENPEPKGPNVVKRILCLANSRKLSGRCIAGREIIGDQPGAWIRPISAREHQEISEDERHYEDGSDPSVLDVIDVPLIEARPHEYQQENWLIDPNFYWRRIGQHDWAELQAFLDPVSPLWANYHSSYSGVNDRVGSAESKVLHTSLRLIRVDELTIEVSRPGAAFGDQKRKVRGQFEYSGTHYNLGVTDPIYERRYRALPDGNHRLGEACLTISLGEPFQGYCYKLTASIVERNRL